MDVFEIIVEYKNISQEILESLSKEDFDEVEILLDKREEIINQIKDEDKKVITEAIKKLNLIELEQKIQTALNEKYQNIREQLKRFNENKTAAKAYLNKETLDSIFLNKKF